MLQFFLKRRIVKDAFFYTASNVFIQISSLLGILIVSRYLGPYNLGLYSFVQNYLTIFVTVIAGLDCYANWTIVQKENKLRELALYVRLKTIIVSFFSLLFLLFSFFVLPQYLFFLVCILLIPSFTNIFASYLFLLQYENKAVFVSVATLASSFLLLICKIAAVFFKAPLSIFLFINSLDGLLVIFLAYFYFKKMYGILPKVQYSYKDFFTLLKNSFSTIVYMCTWFLFVRIDQFFIPLFFSTHTLGLYASAVKVVEMTNVLVVIMQSLLVPRVHSLFASENGEKKFRFILSAYGTLGLGTAILISLFSPFIIHILFGEAFKESVAILRVYAFTIPGLFITYFYTVMLLSQRKYADLAIKSIKLLLLTLLLTYIAAKTGSILIVALVSVFTYTLASVILCRTWGILKKQN